MKIQNYVTVVKQPNGLFAWKRVIGERKATSTTLIEGFERACEVARVIAECNDVRFREPVMP